jgi:hypothetical protein
MNCNCNKIKAPVITPTLAAGSTASPYYVNCNITQQLCYNTCISDVPVFAPAFSLKQVISVGAGQYVAVVSVAGIISYVRCGNGGCSCCMQQPIAAEFTIPFASATTPTSVTVSQGSCINAMAVTGCADCSKTFVSECPLTLTVA